MMILRPYEPKLLMPVPVREWRTPSAFVPKDEFGNDTTHTLFRIRARAHDGHVVWRGIFRDRDDLDAFLFALVSGSLGVERDLWRLPSPEWHPGIGTDLVYEFSTQTILTTTGSNQTYTSPSDWDNAANTVECLGGGASGARVAGAAGHGTGGGGAAYSKITNFSFASPGTTTATYRVAAGGASSVATSSAAGNNGEPTWFNASADPGNGADNTKCSAAGGTAGVVGTGSQNGGAGGATTAGWGTTKNAGGRGGNLTGASGTGGSGGGGAAGPSGAGGAGADSTSTGFVATAGGSANNGTTAGGASNGGAGGNGTEFSASYGCGSGGGGNNNGSANAAGAGGNYGGGGGAGSSSSVVNVTTGAGKQGLVVITYTPLVATYFPTNLPMLGM